MDWIASGPDEFGDFHVSSKGEQLAKCVVIQNGFRTPEETKAIASQVIAAVNNHEALKAEVEMLRNTIGLKTALMRDQRHEIERLRSELEQAREQAKRDREYCLSQTGEDVRLVNQVLALTKELEQAKGQVEKLRTLVVVPEYLQKASDRATACLVRETWQPKRAHIESYRNTMVSAANTIVQAFASLSSTERNDG